MRSIRDTSKGNASAGRSPIHSANRDDDDATTRHVDANNAMSIHSTSTLLLLVVRRRRFQLPRRRASLGRILSSLCLFDISSWRHNDDAVGVTPFNQEFFTWLRGSE